MPILSKLQDIKYKIPILIFFLLVINKKITKTTTTFIAF